MECGSLFTGIGGFDLGFELAGIKCVWQAEVDKFANQVLEERFPNTRRYNDVKEITADTPAVDVITGGFPCQDVSVAGKRAGFKGERSSLWFEFYRIISELKPEWVVIENVTGLLSSHGGRDFATVIQGLGELGYFVAWRVLDSKHFGVAQRRRRVFIVGSLGHEGASEVLFEREGECWNPASRKETGKKDTRSIENSIGEHNSHAVRYALTRAFYGRNGPIYNKEISHTLDQYDQQVVGPVGKYWDGSDTADTFTSCQLSKQQMHPEKRHMPAVFAYQWASGGGDDPKETAQTLRSQAEHNYQFIWQMNHASEVVREASGNKAPTLQARMGTGGNNVTLVGVRRLTPVECERLQAFPDGWTDPCSDTQRYKQLGNAVTVTVAWWIAHRIMQYKSKQEVSNAGAR